LTDAGATSEAQTNLIALTRKAQNCVKSAAGPKIDTQDGNLKFYVGEGKDVVFDFSGKAMVSISDIAEKSIAASSNLAALSAKLEAQLVVNAKAAKDQIEAAAKDTASTLETAAEKRKKAMDTLFTDLEAKVDANDGVRDVEAVAAAAGAAAKANGEAIAALKKYTEEQIGNLYCSYNGVASDDKPPKCTCKSPWRGDRCEDGPPKSCKDETTKTGVVDLVDGSNTWCSAEQGGGWDLAFNLATAVAPSMHWNHAFWKESTGTTGSVKAPFAKDFKGKVYNSYAACPYKEVMLMAYGGRFWSILCSMMLFYPTPAGLKPAHVKVQYQGSRVAPSLTIAVII
jgi:hypothetical protein